MSVNQYLTDTASRLLPSREEQQAIATSVNAIALRLGNYFGTEISKQFRFGSSVRDTMLPRSVDESADVDYMVVFSNSGGTYKPQTYLNKLRQFTDRYYSTSISSQSSPAVKLQMQHILFELVPATPGYWAGQYQIPAPAKDYSEWLTTDPTEVDKIVNDANASNRWRIKPLIRLVKYWNVQNDTPFNSYLLEKYAASQNYWGASLGDCFYQFWNQLNIDYTWPIWVREKVQRTKEKVARIKLYEDGRMPLNAESQLKELLPTL